MNIILEKLLKSRHLEYLVIDENFLIIETSLNVHQFANNPQEIQLKHDVRLSFSVLNGLENIITDIFSGNQTNFVLQNISADSSLYFDIYLILDPEGINNEPKHLIVIFENVTKQRILTQKFSQLAADYLPEIIGSLEEALLITNPQGEIKAINKKVIDLFGYQEEELLNKKISLLFATGEFAREEIDLLPPGIGSKEVELVCKKKTGETLYMAFSCLVIRADQKNLWDLVYIGKNITKSKQIELDLSREKECYQLLRMITWQILQELDLEEIINTIVSEVQGYFQCDRVIIYSLDLHGNGKIIAEAIADNSLSLLENNYLEKTIDQSYWQKNLIDLYQKDREFKLDNITTQKIDSSYISLLNQLEICSELVLPISINSPELESPTPHKLWGLLSVQNCQIPRQWQQWEIDLLKQLTKELGIAIQYDLIKQKLQKAYQKLDKFEIIDKLTNLATSKAFDDCLDFEWKRLTRENQSLSLIVSKVDNFQVYQEIYGIEKGNFCLQQIANVLSKIIQRSSDLVARHGEEEFAIILPNTDSQGAFCVAKKIEIGISELKIPFSQSEIFQSQTQFSPSQFDDFITLSIGIASMIPSTDYTHQNLFDAAINALTNAQTKKVDRIEIYPQS